MFSYKYRQSSFNYSPKDKDSAYELTLVGNQYNFKRTYNFDRYVKNILEKYRSLNNYTGKLFTIIAETLYNSIGLYFYNMENDTNREDYYVKNKKDENELYGPIGIKVHVNGLYKISEHLNIYLTDFLTIKEWNENYSNKELIVYEWANIMKGSKILRPFLDIETNFTTWDPHDGTTYKIDMPVDDFYSRTSDYEYIIKNDPETNPLMKEHGYRILGGILSLEPSPIYKYKILHKNYEEIIENYLSKEDYNCYLTGEKSLDEMTLEEAIDFSSDVNNKSVQYSYKGGQPKLIVDYTYVHTRMPKEPKIGDTTLSKDGDYIYDYLLKNYPEFCNRVNSLTNDALEKLETELHNKSEIQYNNEDDLLMKRLYMFSYKQTHIDIIKAFLNFEDALQLEYKNIDTVDDFIAYCLDLYGSVAEYLSNKGQDAFNKMYNDKQIKILKEHPRKKTVLLKPNSDELTRTPYNMDLLNSGCSELDFVNFNKHDERFGVIQETLDETIGRILPYSISSRFKTYVSVHNKDAEFKVNLDRNSFLSILNKHPEEEIKIIYKIIPDVIIKEHHNLMDDRIKDPNNLLDQSNYQKYLQYKKLIFKRYIDCFTGKFKFEIKTKLWDGSYPPYKILVERDEDKFNEFLDYTTNKDPIFNELYNIYYVNYKHYV